MSLNENQVVELLEQQKGRVLALQQAIASYGKDSRKYKASDSYHEKKLKKLQDWWLVFEKTNNELRPHLKTGQPYLDEDTFKDAMELYKSYRTTIQHDMLKAEAQKEKGTAAMRNQVNGDESQQNHSEHASTSTEAVNQGSNDTSVNLLADSEDDEGMMESSDSTEMRVLNFQFLEMKQILKEAEKVNEGAGLATAQLEMVKTVWADFRAAYRNISIANGTESLTHIKFHDMQATFLAICGKLNDVIGENKNGNRINTLLPKIKIPEFDGKATNWRAFKDIFDTSVHNDVTLSKGMKMQLLKTNLKGDAAKLVMHIAPTEQNYDTCYHLLSNRYDNKREILGNMLDEILNIPAQRGESSDGLKLVHDTTYECIMSNVHRHKYRCKH